MQMIPCFSLQRLFLLFSMVLVMLLGCNDSSLPVKQEVAKEKALPSPPPEKTHSPAPSKENEQPTSQPETASFKKITLPKEFPENATFQEPRILPGDTLQIDVAGESDLSREFVVPNNGTIYFPLIKKVVVEGKTIKELTQELTKSLSAYLVEPIVNVSVTKWGERNVYVYGSQRGSEVVSLPINEAMTVSRLLISIGIPSDADLSKVDLIRKNSAGKKVVMQIPLDDILKDYSLDKDVILQPGDLVVLHKSAKVYIQGNVRDPGTYPINQNEKMTLLTLISQAKGATENADLSQVKIIRQLPDKQKEVMVVSAEPTGEAGSTYLQADDIVIIPSRSDNLVTIYGEVKNPGSIRLSQKNARLSTIIARAGGLTEYSSYTIRVLRYLDDGSTKKMTVDFKAITLGDAQEDILIQPGDVIYIDSSIF